MVDVLIRDVPDAVLAGVSVDDLRGFADKIADLVDDEVMDAAWR